MTLCISLGWAPALQIVQVPLHPVPCDTLAALGCLQLGCAGSRQSSRQVIVDRHYQEKLENLPALGINKSRVAHQPGKLTLPGHGRQPGAAGAACRAQLSRLAVLSGKEMSKSCGPRREGEEQDSRAPPGILADPLPPSPAAIRHLLPLPQFPPNGTAASIGSGREKTKVKNSPTATQALRCLAGYGYGGGWFGEVRQWSLGCQCDCVVGSRWGYITLLPPPRTRVSACQTATMPG